MQSKKGRQSEKSNGGDSQNNLKGKTDRMNKSVKVRQSEGKTERKKKGKTERMTESVKVRKAEGQKERKKERRE